MKEDEGRREGLGGRKDGRKKKNVSGGVSRERREREGRRERERWGGGGGSNARIKERAWVGWEKREAK
jgi:hypothetical protein